MVQTGALTAGRDVNFGLTPEQVKELTEAAVRGATDPLTSAIIDLSKRLGVTDDATKTLLRIVGERDVPLERLSETLNCVANDYKRLQGQAAALNLENTAARDLVRQAKIAILTAFAGAILTECHALISYEVVVCEVTMRHVVCPVVKHSVRLKDHRIDLAPTAGLIPKGFVIDPTDRLGEDIL